MDKGGRLGREHCGRHPRQSRWCCEPGGTAGTVERGGPRGEGGQGERKEMICMEIHMTTSVTSPSTHAPPLNILFGNRWRANWSTPKDVSQGWIPLFTNYLILY